MESLLINWMTTFLSLQKTKENNLLYCSYAENSTRGCIKNEEKSKKYFGNDCCQALHLSLTHEQAFNKITSNLRGLDYDY